MASASNAATMFTSTVTGNMDFSIMATVLVGEEGDKCRVFTLPAALICKRSIFFNNALKEWLKEGATLTVTLAADDPELFAPYLHILYRESLPLRTLTMSKDEVEDNLHHLERDQVTLSQLYVFAEFLQDTRAKNEVVSCLWKTMCPDSHGRWDPYLPNAEAVTIIYKGTKDGATARRPLADAYASVQDGLNEGGIKDIETAFPNRFLLDLVKKLYSNNGFEEFLILPARHIEKD